MQKIKTKKINVLESHRKGFYGLFKLMCEYDESCQTHFYFFPTFFFVILIIWFWQQLSAACHLYGLFMEWVGVVLIDLLQLIASGCALMAGTTVCLCLWTPWRAHWVHSMSPYWPFVHRWNCSLMLNAFSGFKRYFFYASPLIWAVAFLGVLLVFNTYCKLWIHGLKWSLKRTRS